jgi:PAS domain S-box-containing protein
MDTKKDRRRRALLITLLVLVPVLFFVGWSQASLNLSFIQPSNAQHTLLLLALSAFIFLAFVIFGLILLRILLKLYVERRQRQLGSKFKTKMVVAFLSLSLLPVCFLFMFAYGLLNRTIDRWFSIPFDLIRRDANEIVRQVEVEAERDSLRATAELTSNEELRAALRRGDSAAIETVLARGVKGFDLESALLFDTQHNLRARAGKPWPTLTEMDSLFPGFSLNGTPRDESVRHRSASAEFFVVAHPLVAADGSPAGTLVTATRLPLEIKQIAEGIEREAQQYDRLSWERKSIKRTYLSMLWLLTLLILFAATWFALFLSKQVSVPIQALVEATHAISKGNLAYQISARADDELGILIRSFNDMTQQLQESHQAIERGARELQQANRQLEERGNTMEAILESIPTAVISLNPQGEIMQVNSTVERLFGQARAASGHTLSDLFSPEELPDISRLFRRARRQGVATKQMELQLDSRRAFVAVTVSSIRARHGAVGSVLVLEDLTEILQAQKALAWQEVAQRVAHEIKNPLTPIQLSTERIERLIERANPGPEAKELLATLSQSAALIGREVATLKSLVDEFSEFARFPASKPVPSNLNQIVESALNVFEGRLDGIQVHRSLAPDLPTVQADPEQMRRALVNLIDNAAEVLAHSFRKEIWIQTTCDLDRDIVELVVADSGPGIRPEDKERLFLPFFTTKRRGTGLGLAIVNRIMTEHKGSIRVEENWPTGTKFVIELPVERALT